MVTSSNVLLTKHATDQGTYWSSQAPAASLRHYLRGCATTHFKTADDMQRFWETDKGLQKFLKGFDGERFKQASLGGDQEEGFEQAFSALAYAYLKDKAPRLLDFIIGFQLVDRNEDNTKAMGVFGFKVGDQWLYAPVFFLNGDLKGHELLYVKKQDAFVPMKENWVNYLISRRPHVLGEASHRNTQQLGGLMPNLHRSAGPGGSKYGSDRGGFDEWSHDFLPLVGAIATKSDRVFEKHAGLPERLDMRSFLKEFPLLKMAFEKAYLAYPAIKKGFDTFYGPSFFREMGEQIKQEIASGNFHKTAQSFVLPPKKKPKITKNLIEDEALEHPIKSGALQIITLADYMAKSANDDRFESPISILSQDMMKQAEETMKVNGEAPGGISFNRDYLDEEERAKLLKDKVLIKDTRKGEQVSVAYNTQLRMEMTNPSETGLYKVLEKPGSFDEMLVVVAPHTGRGREKFALVVRKGDTRSWLNTHATNVWVNQQDAPAKADFVKYVDGLGGSETLSKGGTYMAINENGSGTCPFRVREDYGNGSYRVSWEDYCRYGNDRPMGLPRIDNNFGSDYDSGYSSYDAKVWINRRGGTGLRSVNGELSIPESYKIIKLKEPPKPKKPKDDSLIGCCSAPCDSEEVGGTDPSPIDPGNIADVQLMLNNAVLSEKMARFHLHDIGGEVCIKTAHHGTSRHSPRAALISMVRDHGLTEVQSRQMLKDAAASAIRNKAAVYYIKYASPFLQPGPGAPPFPEPLTGVEMNGPNSVNSIYPQEEFRDVPELDSSRTDPSIYDPFYQPDQNAMQTAQQAANSGQKEVFDTSMVSGMLKSVRQDNLVDRYLGDLMKALDKLGRILFMFYWHQDEFEDRYGRDEMPEMEDSLRNAFETLGDVVLYLKEKQVGGGMGMDMSGGGAPDDAEPSIDQAAGN